MRFCRQCEFGLWRLGRVAALLIIFVSARAFAQSDTATFIGTGAWETPALWSHTNPAAAGQFPNNGNAGLTYNVIFNNNGFTATLNQAIAINSFTQNGNTLTGGQNLTLGGLYTWTNGTISGAGTLIANGNVALSNAGDIFIRRPFNNNATATKSTSGNINVLSSGSFNNAGTYSATAGHSFLGDGTGAFNNSGTFTNATGAGITDFFSLRLNNSGLLDIQTGTVRLRVAGTLGGMVNIASGATLELRNGAHNFAVSPPFFSGAGTLSLSNSAASFTTATGGTPLQIPVNVNLLAGNWNSGDAIMTGQVTWSGTTVRGAGTWTVGSPLSAPAGGIDGGLGSITVSSPVQLQQRIFEIGFAQAYVAAALSLSANASMRNFGQVTFQQNSALANVDGSAVQFTNTGDATVTGNNVTFGPAIGSTGVAVENSGTFTVAPGAQLSVAGTGPFEQTKGKMVILGILQIFTSDGNLLHVKSGSIGGRGEIIADCIIDYLAGLGSVSAIKPGQSAGKLTITGNLTLSGSASYEAELGGTTQATQYDLLSVTGVVNLNGAALRPRFINNFQNTIAPTDTFTVLETTQPITGAFFNIFGGRVMAADGTGTFSVSFTNGNTRVVLGNFIPGDVIDSDSDGMSDEFEQQYFGSPTGGDPTADSDGDGFTNLQEYRAGTNPIDARSRLQITEIKRQGNDIVIKFDAASDRSYQLEASANFNSGFPIPIATVPAQPTGGERIVTDVGGATISARAYRVRLLP